MDTVPGFESYSLSDPGTTAGERSTATMKDTHPESTTENTSTNGEVGDDRDERSGVHSERPDLVVCFDRDRTVSVNPSPRPDERAVPLAWVKYLAHDAEAANVDVWATGNQRLCEEAAIPGTAEAVACWKRLGVGDSVAASNASEEEGYAGLDRDPPRPRRRDRLRLIADLYRHSPPAEGDSLDEGTHHPVFVVVDDAVLKDMYEEGFEHFLPWVFCVLVEETDGQPEVFEAAGVSLPLEKLPEASSGGEEGSTGAEREAGERRTLAYTNSPANTGDDECRRVASYYDPTVEDTPTGL